MPTFRQQVRQKIQVWLLEVKAGCPDCQARAGHLCPGHEQELIEILLLPKRDLRQRLAIEPKPPSKRPRARVRTRT